jgi:signal recognition particle receptor subunit beta
LTYLQGQADKSAHLCQEPAPPSPDFGQAAPEWAGEWPSASIDQPGVIGAVTEIDADRGYGLIPMAPKVASAITSVQQNRAVGRFSVMIIGTAGHIDHGKTALVRALTGIDTDRLPEEKRRGMTIDLGFAHRRLQLTTGAGDGPVLEFVDVPGHERFIHNMLAGATGIDFVLLAIAADDGPMPQTREHLDIVSLLHVERGVVALTKTDLVSPDRLAHSEAGVREFLAGSVLRDSAILPVSSVTGEGIPALGQCLINAAGTLSIREPKSGVRFSIDRSFVLAGVGIVVTGTVAAGSISVGERAVLSPSGIDLRIRGSRRTIGQRGAPRPASVARSILPGRIWIGAGTARRLGCRAIAARPHHPS